MSQQTFRHNVEGRLSDIYASRVFLYDQLAPAEGSVDSEAQGLDDAIRRNLPMIRALTTSVDQWQMSSVGRLAQSLVDNQPKSKGDLVSVPLER
jgi:hypothetical protein